MTAIQEQINRSLVRRRVWSRVAVVACVIAVAVAVAPLVALVVYTTAHGIHALSVAFFTQVPTPPGVPGGGIANAIVGTGIIVGIGSVMAIPVAIAAALFLLERRGWLAEAVRFLAGVLSGVPTIAVGIFAYAVLVEPLHHFSAISGSFALAVLMLPVVIRSGEAAMRAVPTDLVDAGLALGARRSRVARRVILRTALPGLVTGSLLAVARAAGETAALLFTAVGSQLWNISPFQETAAMPLTIYTDGTQAVSSAQTVAWGTALCLLVLILLLSIAARAAAAYLTRHAR